MEADKVILVKGVMPDIGILEFVSRLTDSLAWPVVVVLLILLFKRQLLEIIKYITEIKFGSFSFKIERDIYALRAKAGFDRSERSAKFESKFKLSFDDKNFYLITELNPLSGVQEAWEILVRKLNNLVIEKAGSPLPNVEQMTNFKLIKYIEEHELLDPEIIEIIRGLRGLRNRIVHLNNVQLSRKSVDDFIELCRYVDKVINDQMLIS